MSDNRRRQSLIWPLMLIGLGIVFLLNNLGVVSWDIWAVILRMWPVLVIAIGLDLIIGRRSTVWSAVTVVIVLAMFAGAFWLVSVTGNLWNTDSVVVPIAQELGDADSAAVNINMGVGVLDVETQSEPSEMLVEGSVVIAQFEKLREKAEPSEDGITYSLSTTGRQFLPGVYIPQINGQNNGWNLLLSPDVEMDLNVDTGVGKTTLDLAGLQLTDLEVDSGVGEVSIYLPDYPDLDVRVNGGVGQIKLYLPEGVSARIRVDTGLGSLNFDDSFDYENGTYLSEGYDETAPTVTIFLNGGVGNIRVIQLED